MRNAITVLAFILGAVSTTAATIHGVVRDAGGDSLPGVTVYEKGSNDTVITAAMALHNRSGSVARNARGIPRRIRFVDRACDRP